ncbi:MAG: hypothetical protein L0220_07235, partial [Acidobacteria bacterium]|nr:hypothetical protein [Acidobacteriota bacterium]
MSQDPSISVQTADAQSPSPNFKALRFRVALIFALIAATFALIASAILFIGDENIRLYAGFSEFDRTTDDCNCDPNAPPPLDTQEAEPDTIGEHLRRMSKRFGQFITEFVDSFSDHHIAGVSRFLTVIAIFVSTFITYRALLIDRFENEARKSMITVFSHSTRHLIGILFVPLLAAVLSHILLSEGWILLADMFERVEMTAIGAIFITTISVGTLTYIVVRWAVAITSRDLLMFGLLMTAIGLSAGFAVANGDWWQEAISQVGRDSESDLLFTITLVGIALIFFLLWIDLDKLIRDVVGSKFKLVRVLFFAATISVALIGLFPRLGDDSGPYDATYILT